MSDLQHSTMMSANGNCIFCKITQKNAPADIQFENPEIIIFKDIKPAAEHHYLAIPKEHIMNVNSLNTPDHKGLLERLISEGKKVIQEHGGNVNDLILGFHLPPFNTVDHLHLHLISPASSMSFLHKIMFMANSLWFATAEQIQRKLHKLIEQGEVRQINNKL
ncbi:adenosine 5'-monophosphoramidase HINT3-like [Euwallacea similis]|uniref:adenosine 5'-monophosphoramidase HINT3-like n=1 Tax=Euwallacea similis TaxID=1736056 RepID=UPI00344F11C5